MGGVLIAGQLLSGCARPAGGLVRGDEQLVAGRYQVAIEMYGQFLRSYPDDPAASRVRATRDLLERLLRAEEEAARARPELADLRAEVSRLRAALEKLKAIDVQTEQKR